MISDISRDRTVAALDEVWASITSLLVALDDSDWGRPTPLPGWSVQDNVAHIVGTEAMLLGIEPPDVDIDAASLPHVHNDVGVFNETWVQHLRTKQPNEVLSMFQEYTGSRLSALAAMGPDEWNAETFTPGGRDSYGRFMQIRVFDCWLHEQDIRDAVGRPGHASGLAVEVTLDEIELAMGYIVGKRAGLEPGRSVTFELTEDGFVTRSMHVVVEDRARVVDRLDGAPTVALRLPVGVITRLCAGRSDPAEVRDEIVVAGDGVVAERVIGRLAYTI